MTFNLLPLGLGRRTEIDALQKNVAKKLHTVNYLQTICNDGAYTLMLILKWAVCEYNVTVQNAFPGRGDYSDQARTQFKLLDVSVVLHHIRKKPSVCHAGP
jgi:predicted transglutaminase-like protease